MISHHVRMQAQADGCAHVLQGLEASKTAADVSLITASHASAHGVFKTEGVTWGLHACAALRAGSADGNDGVEDRIVRAQRPWGRPRGGCGPVWLPSAQWCWCQRRILHRREDLISAFSSRQPCNKLGVSAGAIKAL